MFLLEVDINAQVPQFAGIEERVHGVATKPGHALGNDLIHQPRTAVLHEPQELRSVLHLGAGDAPVGVNAYKLAGRIPGEDLGVVADLGGKAVELLILAAGHPAVGCDPQRAFLRQCLVDGRDCFLSRHRDFPPFLCAFCTAAPQAQWAGRLLSRPGTQRSRCSLDAPSYS